MTILALVPVKSKMCLQENLVDCADCGGLIRNLTDFALKYEKSWGADEDRHDKCMK